MATASPFGPYADRAEEDVPASVSAPDSEDRSIDVDARAASTSVAPVFLKGEYELASPTVPYNLPAQERIDWLELSS